MNNKKLLFVASRQFWPTTSGKEITLYFNCKGLREKCGYDIYLFCFADKNADRSIPHPDFIKDVVYVDTPKIASSIVTIIKQSFLFDKWPLQNSMFYSNKIAKKLLAYFEKIDPDAMVIDMVRLVPYYSKLPKKSIPKILIEDDLLAKRYGRQIEASGSGNIAGYFSNSMPNFINKITNFKFIKNVVLNLEIKRLNKYENCLASMFDYITFISPIEAEEFNKMHNTDKAVVLTMGADIEYYAESQDMKHMENSMSIVGNFTYEANASSIEWINNNILPHLPKDITYYVIGKFPEELKKTVNDPRVKIMGYVDDIRKVVKATDIYLSPVVFGTGIKTKIIEAMAMGMPVITNSVGAEGLNVTNKKELVIADTAEDMIDAINELKKNDGLRRKIGESGQDYVKKYHDWNKIYDVFGDIGL